MARASRSALLVGVSLLAAALWVGSAPPAEAHAEYTTWKCAPAGCKYAKARVRYDRHIKFWYVAYWRGGTASGSCDPGNNVIKWRLNEIRAINGLDYSYGPAGWRTNCNVDSWTWRRTVNRFWSGGLDIRYSFFHDVACAGCDFTSYIWVYG